MIIKNIIDSINFLSKVSTSGMLTPKLVNGLSFIYVSSFFSTRLDCYLFDAPLPWQMNFQQSASPTMEGIVDLHHNIMLFMIYIVIFISYILIRAIMLFNSNKKSPFDPISRTRHHLSLEIIWTILPLIILFWIALPSFALLYSIDHCPKVDLTIKVIGRQWYWTYEIDAFIKYKMKKPNYNTFLETSIIYELLDRVSEKIFEDKSLLSSLISDQSFIDPKNSSSSSIDDLVFFGMLNNVLNSNFKVKEAYLDNIIKSYLSVVGSNRRLESPSIDINSYSLSKEEGNVVFPNKLLNTEISPEYASIWSIYSNYKQVPAAGLPCNNDEESLVEYFKSDSEKEKNLPPVSNDLENNTDSNTQNSTESDEDKLIFICPKIVNPEILFAGSPCKILSAGFEWSFDTLIENFDEIYNENNETGFNFLDKVDFFKLLSYLLVSTSIEDYERGMMIFYPGKVMTDMDCVLSFKNENDYTSFFFIRSFINMPLYDKSRTLIYDFLRENHTLISKTNLFSVFTEYYYYNANVRLARDVKDLSLLYYRSNFKGSELLKDFFFALTTGEFYDFTISLEKNNLSLNEFITNFSHWYHKIEEISKLSNLFVENIKSFQPVLDAINNGDISWTDNLKTSVFSECPTPFVKTLNKYKNWSSFVSSNEIFLNNEEVVKNKKLADSLIFNETAKVFLFFHAICQKDENVVNYLANKNKFFHYLVEFDSCIVSDNEVYNNYLNISRNEKILNLENLPTSFCGWWRLLEVDNRLVLPIKTRLRILVTSSDVLHSWAVPSLGVKIDACPGRLNCVYVYIKRPGVFHGQCSELCGVKHGFMPIVVHAVTRDKYNRWFADTCELVG